MDTKQFGVLRSWVAARGFGFIAVVDEKGALAKYFLHRSKVISGTPTVGAGVRFDVSPVREGELPSAIAAEIGEVVPKYASATKLGVA